MTNAECKALPADDLEPGLRAVEHTVTDKIESFLHSAGFAERFAR